MSDAIVPSYRVRPVEEGLPWRLLAIAGGVMAVVALGGAAWWGASRMGLGGGRGGVPVVEPDPRPVKVRPENPGGLRVANQDEIIFDRNARQRARPRDDAQLAPEPERPALDQLRAQVAPPPAVMEPVTPAAPPAATQAASGPAGDGSNTGRSAAVAPAVPATPEAAPSQLAAGTTPAMPAPVAVQPAAVPTAPAPNGRIQIQLGALTSEEAARAEWDRLTRRMPDLLGAFRPQITRFDRGEGTLPMWRLRTGGFADPAAARAFCEQARGRGAACAVIGG